MIFNYEILLTQPNLNVSFHFCLQNTKLYRNIRKVVKDLQPLTSQFKRIPRSRRRVATFSQNHQFTVIAAEFLNLSSKEHLNELHKSGYTIDQIETFLERKYRKKQKFWLNTEVVHHRFKRKDFNTWTRLMNDASIFNSNTILDEDQLSKELPREDQMIIKSINSTNIENFTSDTESTSNESDNESMASTKSHLTSKLASDPTLIVLSSERRFSLTSATDRAYRDIAPLELDVDSQIKISLKKRKTKLVEDDQDERQLEDVGSNKGFSQSVKPSNRSSISQNLNSLDNKLSQESETSQQLLNNIFDEITNIQTLSNEATEKVLASPIANYNSSPTPISLDSEAETESVDNIQPLQHSQQNIEHFSGRRLRQRNIVNRNPYLVDRAEYLGLSTPMELSDLAESGKTDDQIIAYLESIYQKRRIQRKDNGYGYGPYSKATFREIMEATVVIENNLATNNPNTQEDEEFNIGIETQTREDDDEDEEFDDLDDLDELNNFDLVSKSEAKVNEAVAMQYLDDSQLQESLDQSNKTEHSQCLVAEDSSIASTTENRNHFSNHPKTYTHKTAKMFGDNERKLTGITLQGVHNNENKIHRARNQLSAITAKEKDTSFPVSKRLSYTSRKLPDLQSKIQHSSSENYQAFADPLLDLGFSDNEEDNRTNKRMKLNTIGDMRSNSVMKPNKDRFASTRNKPSLIRSKSNITTLDEKKKYPSLKARKIESTDIYPRLERSTSLLLFERQNSEERSKTPISQSGEMVVKNSKKKASKNVIAASYAPKHNSVFQFNREVSKGTYQAEGILSYFQKQSPGVASTKLNLLAARGVDVIRQERSGIANNENWTSMKKFWNRYQDETFIQRRMKVFMELKPEHFAEFDKSSKLLTSTLISQSLSVTGTYYYNSNITIQLDKSDNIIYVPIRAENNIMKSLKEFFSFFSVALRSGRLSNHRLIQIRKTLINIVRLCWNLSRDLPTQIIDVGLLINEFLNSLRDHPPEHELFCFFSPFLLTCMMLLQKFTGPQSIHFSTFQKSARWIQKRFIMNFCQIPYQLFFLSDNKFYFESLNLFLILSKNPWDLVTQPNIKFNILDVTCALYYFNQIKKVEVDWAFYIQQLILLGNLKKDGVDANADDVEAKNLCAIILKLNSDLGWEIEPPLLIRVFRLLSAYKFDNIGTTRKPKASLYPENEPSTLIYTPEDGSLDLYFKLMSKFAQGYIRNCNAAGYQLNFLETDLTPGSTLNGYNSIQLQNRAKAVLMLWIIFDKDVLAYLENIVEAMFKEASAYSYKSLLSLLKLMTTRISRKPLSTVLKFIPQIVESLNITNSSDAPISEFTELLDSIRANLASDEHLPIKSSLQLMLYLMKLKQTNLFEGSIWTIFEIIQLNWIFSIQRANEKEVSKINKLLNKFANVSKKKILDKNSGSTTKMNSLRYWIFARTRVHMAASQIYYQEWKNFGDSILLSKMELSFFTQLVKLPTSVDIKNDIILCFFKYLPNYMADIKELLQGMQQRQLLDNSMIKYCNLSADDFHKRRTELAISALSSIIHSYSKEQLSRDALSVFIKNLKEQYTLTIDSEYIKEISVYIYTVFGDRISMPEWRFLEAKLKLETVTGSLSKQIEYAGDIKLDRLITSIIKSYIAAIINGELAQFTSDFKRLFTTTNASKKLSTAVSQVISFHIKSIMDGNDLHDWIHLSFWMKIMYSMLEYSWLQLDFDSILSILKEASKLSAYYVKSETCIYYYHTAVITTYGIIRLLKSLLAGFIEGVQLKTDFNLFAGMDPKIINNQHYSNSILKPNILADLSKYFNENSLILNSKYFIIRDQQVIYEMSEKVDQERVHTMEYLGVKLDHLSIL